ncbi:hypothetical protein GCM10007320_44090 [Pseudorhodoferax aquiterrae]|uniref:Inner membrane protein YgaP-like transmembrane domain-containing protein n=1 Tax=Pseudorhodoferax aquiterrae TaxID=747304 RepID=A0ABQ3G7Q5_9BURK|nr:YgaP-like transmembrane domain [Pseudorhodoferax aquiterrae]GHC93292.1 hypothetical protein GCM10007320_44090 [Pseudorhodoferax aquiterrae]
MFYLKRNLPLAERAARLALAAAALTVAYVWSDIAPLAWAAGVSACTLAGTAIVGFCPACALLGRKPVAR